MGQCWHTDAKSGNGAVRPSQDFRRFRRFDPDTVKVIFTHGDKIIREHLESWMSLATRLAEERRARLAAERLLELKQAELFAANRKLDAHARDLSHQVEETQAENEQVKSDLNAAHERVQLAEQR